MKKAVVTGGSRGLGRAVCYELGRRGYSVLSLSREEAAARSCAFLPLDLSSAQSRQEAAERLKELHPEGLDLFVSCAGFGISGPFEETPAKEVRRQFDVNVLGAWELAGAVIPLLEKRGGRLLFISSVAAVVPLPFQSVYSAGKAALSHLSRALDMELRPLGMRSLCAELGDIRTGFTDRREKQRCSERYAARCRRSVEKMEADERSGEDPASAAPRILARALSKNPPSRWTHGAKYQVLSTLFRLLPERASGAVVRKIYG